MSLLSRLQRRAVGQVAAYGVATGLAAVLTLMQTRVLWRALTPVDFGTWALIDPLLLPLAGLTLFGIDQAVFKQLHVDRVPFRAALGSLLATTLPASAACLLLIAAIGRCILHLPWTEALLSTIAGEALVLLLQTACRAAGSASGFAALVLSRNLLYLSVLLVVHYGARDGGARDGLMPVGSAFLARGACVILVSLLAVAALRPLPRIDWGRYRDALRYGFPLLATSFIYSTSDMVDRWLLAHFSGVVAVGIYTLHLKAAAILGQAVVVPFGLWFPGERFRRMDAPDHGHRFFRRVAAGLTVACVHLAGALWLARGVVLGLIAPGITASPLILACCLGSVMGLAVSHAVNVGLLLPGQTGKNVWCTGAAIAASGLACTILVPLFGAEGAALGRITGSAVLVAVTAWWSWRVLPVPLPFIGMTLFCATAAPAAVLIDHAISHALPGGGRLALCAALLAWTLAAAALGGLLWLSLSWRRGPALPAAPVAVQPLGTPAG